LPGKEEMELHNQQAERGGAADLAAGSALRDVTVSQAAGQQSDVYGLLCPIRKPDGFGFLLGGSFEHPLLSAPDQCSMPRCRQFSARGRFGSSSTPAMAASLLTSTSNEMIVRRSFGSTPFAWSEAATSAGKRSSMAETREAVAVQIEVSDDTLTVELADGRTIAAPLAWYPRLAHGSTEERKSWRLLGGGRGIHWPALDEDISVANLLAGQPSAESRSSFKKWLASRSKPTRTRRKKAGAEPDAPAGQRQ
jgi:hypothetical protein